MLVDVEDRTQRTTTALFPFMSSEHMPQRGDYEPQILFCVLQWVTHSPLPVKMLSSLQAPVTAQREGSLVHLLSYLSL